MRVVSQSPPVRLALEEEAVARNYVVNRHQFLVNRKYIQGLSAEETEELNGLEGTLDDMDKPFYEGIIARVRALVEKGMTA